MYLYSILPYVDNCGVAPELGFFRGGRLAGFREERVLRQARHPFDGDTDDQPIIMWPWMTPLSAPVPANGYEPPQTVIVYNARTHRIGLLDRESGLSTEHNLWPPEEEGLEEDSGGEDGEAASEEGGEDHGLSHGTYGGMNGRRAGDVLRGIIQWFADIVEAPGGADGEDSGLEWGAAEVRSLYRLHGWPGADFDGDAFLVDKAHVNAVLSAKRCAEDLARKVRWLRSVIPRLDEKSPAVRETGGKVAAAGSVEEEWLARWELFKLEQSRRYYVDKLQELEDKRDREAFPAQGDTSPEWALHEWKVLHERFWGKKLALEKLEQEFQDAQTSGCDIERSLQIRLRHAEQETTIYQRAYEISRVEAERLFPEKSFTPGTGVEQLGLELSARLEALTKRIGRYEREAERTRDWIAQLPDGAARAGEMAKWYLDGKQKAIERILGQKREVSERMEELSSRCQEEDG